MKTWVLLMLATFQYACAGRSSIDKEDLSTTRDGNAVINQYYRAIGGYDRLKAIQRQFHPRGQD